MADKVTKRKVRETNEKYFKSLYLDMNGNAYIVLGNTYPIKDELKAAGAHFKPGLGWYFDHVSYDYPTQKIERDDFMSNFSMADLMIDVEDADPTEVLLYHYDEGRARDFVKEIQDKYRKANTKPSNSQWVGEVGDKIEKELKLEDSHPFISSFTGDPMCVYKFVDEFGNVFTWITSDRENLVDGGTYEVKGTIKNHSEYRDEKQTVLTRCKYQ